MSTVIMVQGGMSVVKYLLFLFNFIFWLSGIGLIVGGTVIEIRYKNYANILGSSFLSTPILLIVIGCIVAIVGFFGCCGAIRESYCMTMTFAVLLGVIFILELAAGIATYVLRSDMEKILIDHVGQGMKFYGKNGAGGITKTWDKMQHDLKCCGLEKYMDWNSTEWYLDQLSREDSDLDIEHVPGSCCITQRSLHPTCNMDIFWKPEDNVARKIYTKGCLPKLKDEVKGNVAIVGGIGCGVALIQILGICFACCLSKSILKDYEEGYYY